MHQRDIGKCRNSKRHMETTINIKIKKLLKEGHKTKENNAFYVKPQGIKFLKRQTLNSLKTNLYFSLYKTHI